MSHTNLTPVDYRLLFERSTELYLILDPQFRILAASDVYCRATKTRQDDIVGHHVFEIFPDDASRPGVDGPDNLRDSLERVLKFRRADAMATQRYDVRRPGAEGGGFDEKYWSPMNVPVLDDDGEVRWIVHRVNDVTVEIKNPQLPFVKGQLERDQELVIQRLRQANEELAHLDTVRAAMVQMSPLSTIATMAGALAHDIAQPLSAVRNYLGALKKASMTSRDPVAESLIAKMQDQVVRAADIVKGLREYAAAGVVEHRVEPLAPVLHEAIKLSGAIALARGAEIVEQIDRSLPNVLIDRVQIQQLMVNLIANAAEAMKGCMERRVDISASVEKDVVRVDVADTGSGIAHDAMQRLFEPFSTTRMTEIGLGLPICVQIIKDHDGSISATANRPTGTVFTFTLPFAPEAGHATVQHQ